MAIARRLMDPPVEPVKVHDRVTVSVLEVDLERGRISLSMKDSLRRRR